MKARRAIHTETIRDARARHYANRRIEMLLGAGLHKHHYVRSLPGQPNDEYRAMLTAMRGEQIVTGSSPARLTMEGQHLAAGIVCAHGLATFTAFDEVTR